MYFESLSTPVSYEKRIVCFFDILGWKNHITAAGQDPIEIGKLTYLPRILTSELAKTKSQTGNGKITSFSDCAVASMPIGETSISNFIAGLSNVFIGAALNGFFLRAGVTIGEIYHTDEMVFGPALNRAYDLESKGGGPRILLDDDIEEFNNAKMDIIFREDKLFADPFTLSFFRRNELLNKSISGSESPGVKHFLEVEKIALNCMEKAAAGADQEKMRWLYRRLRAQSRKIFSPD
ncbi:hypothetical protein [Pseudomonas prosekii]|uniref:hypothetical protein n=1 Tax=Pseudomonas prosekii TaxID=1148509 RepID=UPI00387AF57A